MSASLVGSEMCIRDRYGGVPACTCDHGLQRALISFMLSAVGRCSGANIVLAPRQLLGPPDLDGPSLALVGGSSQRAHGRPSCHASAPGPASHSSRC
eukprot:4709808-Alexandrium_andersonii.AAC.1